MNSRFKATEQITNACRKGRNAFFAINGIMSNSTKPCVLVKLYKSVVLPTCFIRLWNMKQSKINSPTTFTTFQHFIVKKIQNLRTCTWSDMCQSLLRIYPISSYIDTRKLLFLQKLCSLHDSFLTKRIKRWNVVGLLILDCFTFHSRIKQVGKTTDLYNLTRTRTTWS